MKHFMKTLRTPVGEMALAATEEQLFPLTRGVNAQPERYVVIEEEDFRTRLLLVSAITMSLPVALVALLVSDVTRRAWQGRRSPRRASRGRTAARRRWDRRACGRARRVRRRPRRPAP